MIYNNNMASKEVILMAQILVRVDDQVKKDADMLFGELGMTTQTAINVFLREAKRRQGFPFEVQLDPFYSKSNMSMLRQSIADMEAGINISEHELLEAD
jgi:DNA-damage-inducible protein J